MIRFCSLSSGSSGNAVFLRSDDTRILIDAGVSAKYIARSLESIGESAAELDAIILTHEHSDHTSGIGVMSRKFRVPVYANEKTWKNINPRHDGIQPEHKMLFETGVEFVIGGIAVRPFQIPHDAADPVGFNFRANGNKVTLATDIGHITLQLLEDLLGSDAILIESNHDIKMLKDGRYPPFLKQRILSNHGHLSNEMCGKLVCYLAEHGTRNFMLGHLSQENNIPELAYETVCGELLLKDISPDRDVRLIVALRDRVGQVFEL